MTGTRLKYSEPGGQQREKMSPWDKSISASDCPDILEFVGPDPLVPLYITGYNGMGRLFLSLIMKEIPRIELPSQGQLVVARCNSKC